MNWLLVALGLAVIVPRADAAEPSLLDYFQACGIGDDAFAKFADDRQIADEELDVIRRIAVRLRDCPADRLRRMIAASEIAGDDWRSTASGRPEGFPRPQKPRASVGGCSNSKVPSRPWSPWRTRTASRSGDAP